MRIGELAQRSDCDAETVRFYEREKLIEAPPREANGYRSYSDVHLVQLNFIRHCRSLGMSLPEVRILRSFQANPELAQRLDLQMDALDLPVNQQIDLVASQLERQLHTLRDTCHANQKTSECGIMRNLAQAAEGEGCSCHPKNTMN
jgi:DNA-binding transcriptional MerR regulator